MACKQVTIRTFILGRSAKPWPLAATDTPTMQNHRPNVLVICGRNKKRSRTAEHIFKNDDRFSVRSAGISPSSDRVVTEKDINWADIVFVMERRQASRISSAFAHLDLPRIEVLDIDDVYEFMDEELIDLLQDRINGALKLVFEI
ncbi:hypothetical protein [Flaviaesturariibacter amylovorans]|uniref:Phosphotyrosine protein phosphatase I domain-containing protein n=1 Tax=Flaviaesturariibacter amylovorans TaxID=1084520 RepID=A0ABP8GJF4_9BACT